MTKIFAAIIAGLIVFAVQAEICNYGGYCLSSHDCFVGSTCVKQNQFYSQCVPPAGNTCVGDYQQCGGLNKVQYCCASSTCVFKNVYYSQCIPLPCTFPSGFATESVALTDTPSVKPSPAPLTAPAPITDALDTALTHFGQIIYSDPNTCNTVDMFMLYPLSNYCQAATDFNSTIVTGHLKYTCGTNSASTVYYEASDSTCTTPKNSVSVSDYGICPTATTAPKSLCLGSADVNTLTQSVKGIVFTEYSSESACQVMTVSERKRVYYSNTGFDLEGVPLYQCQSNDSGGSYAYICNGADGIQQLGYSTSNCKGASSLIRAAKFQEMGFVCQYIPDGQFYIYPTCSGPANMD